MSARPLRSAAQSAQSAIQYFAGKDAAAEEERQRAKRNIQCYDISSDSEDAALNDEDSEADYSGSQSSISEDGDGSRAQDDVDNDDDEDSDGLDDEEPAEEAVDPVSDEEDDGPEGLAFEHGSSGLVLGRPHVKDKLSSLPLEVRYLILSHLDRDPYAILCMKHVSRQWCNTLNHGPGAEHLWWSRCRAIEPARQLRARGCKTWRESYIRIMHKHCMRCLVPTTAVFGKVWPEGPNWAVVCLKCQWTSPEHHCMIERDAVRLGAKPGTLKRMPFKYRYRKGWHKEYLFRTLFGRLPDQYIMGRGFRKQDKRATAKALQMAKRQHRQEKRDGRPAKKRLSKGVRRRQREERAKLKADRRQAFQDHLRDTVKGPYSTLVKEYEGSSDLIVAALESAHGKASLRLANMAKDVRHGAVVATSELAADFVDYFIDTLAVKAEITRQSPLSSKDGSLTMLLARKLRHSQPAVTWLDLLSLQHATYTEFFAELEAVKGQAEIRYLSRTARKPPYDKVSGQPESAYTKRMRKVSMISRTCVGSSASCKNTPSIHCPYTACKHRCPGCPKHGGQRMPIYQSSG